MKLLTTSADIVLRLSLAASPSLDSVELSQVPIPARLSIMLPSVPGGFIAEPKEKVNLSERDRFRIGFNQATLIMKSPWITMRYLGERPDFRGLLNPEGTSEVRPDFTVGPELSQALNSSLGKPNDISPVVISAGTVHNMMENYFKPLLQDLPTGRSAIKKLHVEGAYFSPTYNPSDNYRIDYDNAFIVGEQLLFVYPSSCFHMPSQPDCRPPFLSTGHDATVIAHELGHVIFNLLRRSERLKGFQWFAINEGYADYFSASWHEKPLIGSTWKSTHIEAPYLRKILDHPTTRDPEAQRTAHSYGVVWSSFLWKSRTRIATALASSGASDQDVSEEIREFDRSVLLSITHLGEGGGGRLGDAGAALLKATYERGNFHWDTILRSGLSESEIIIQDEGSPPVQTPITDLQNTTSPKGGCSPASIGHRSTATPAEAPTLIPVISWIALGLFLLSRRRRLPLWLSALFLLFILQGAGGCIQRKAKPVQVKDLLLRSPPPVSYRCDLHLLTGSTRVFPALRRIGIGRLAHPEGSPSQENEVKLVIFDAGNDTPAHALLAAVDPEHRRLDRLLLLDGKPFQASLSAERISIEEASRLEMAELAQLLLDDLPQKLLNSPSEKQENPKSVDILSRSTLVNISFSKKEAPWPSASLLPERITGAKGIVCIME